MLDDEKATRSKVLEKLNVSDEILSIYEKELDLTNKSKNAQEYSEEDFKCLEILHRLRKFGFSYNEVKLYSTFAEILNSADFKDIYEIKSLQRLSPINRLKESNEQSLAEVTELKNQISELEKKLETAIEENNKKLKDKEEEINTLVEKNKETDRELQTKEDSLQSLSKRLQESLTRNSELETKMSSTRTESEARLSKLNDAEQKIAHLKNEVDVKQKAIETLDSKLSASMSDKSKFESQLMPIRADLEAKIQAFESLDKQLSAILLQKSSLESEIATARVELDVARNARKDLEEYSTRLKADAEIKQKTYDSMDKQMSDALVKISNLTNELNAYKNGELAPQDLKGKKSKELYELLVKKELEAKTLESKIKDLEEKLKINEKENESLRDLLEALEGGMSEIEEEISSRYKEQITKLKTQVEGLITKKQKEWDDYYKNITVKHENELTAKEKKYNEELKALKEAISKKETKNNIKSSGIIANLIKGKKD